MLAFLNFKQDDIGHEFRTDVAWMNMKTHELFSDRGVSSICNCPISLKRQTLAKTFTNKSFMY